MATALLAIIALGLVFSLAIGTWGIRGTLLTVTLVTYLLPQTQLPLPFDSRGIGLAAISLLILHSAGSGGGRALAPVPWQVLAPFAFLLLSALWSLGTGSSIAGQALFVVALLGLVAVPFSEGELKWSIIAWGGAIGLLTVWLGVTDPSALQAGERLRGVMSNANGLALAAVICLPAMWTSGRFASWVATPAAFMTVWFTGARSALAAVVAQIILLVMGRMRILGRVLATLSLIVGAIYAVPQILAAAASSGAGSSSVLRSNNSRTGVWQASLERIREAPVVGTGLGSLTSDFEPGSSIFSIMILSGLIGLAITVVCVGSVLTHGARAVGLGDWRLALVVGALINALFEGWLVTAGTPAALIFWLTCSQIARRRALDGADSQAGRPTSDLGPRHTASPGRTP